MLFWTLIFPFVLGTFFYLALGNIGASYELEIIPIAVVKNEYLEEDEILKNVISSLSEKSDNQLFETKYTTKETAETLLENESIEGYIVLEDKNLPKMVVKRNGINQTIIKSVLDEYYQMASTANHIIDYNPQAIYDGTLQLLSETGGVLEDKTNENIDFSINYFFTLIAMTCLYGSLIGLEVVKDTEANLSKKGARMCMAPINKFKIVLAGLLAGYVVQGIALGLLFAYLITIFKINFSTQILPTVILSAVGCLAGIALGTFIGVSNKKTESFKIGLLIAVIMACCFFSGMMGEISLKAYFDETFPLFAKINPVNTITDGLYALFAYDNLTVYYNCLARIAIFALVLMLLSYIFIRRKKYDSI